MKRFLLLAVAAVLVATGLQAQAQRIGCVRVDEGTRASEYHVLSDPFEFAPNTTYRQPVVLISFSDTDFSMDDPSAYYDRIFNEPGFNEGLGRGCVADYLRDQSGGRVNLQFDIYGPVKINEKAGGRKSSDYGVSLERLAMSQLCETEETDFAIYDWDGDNSVNQVIFVLAGYTGNQKSGYIWPNTGAFICKMPGGIHSRNSSTSCELWRDGSLCGISTIIHEFCHCLGLPDIYPMPPSRAFSAVDEWDLMDGGNYSNYGWCPPNLSAMEKMYLGWASPVELTEATAIKAMKPVSAGGDTYIVRSSGNSNEFYLLENRRQEGWDYSCPGNGLLIFHVDYDRDCWGNNEVNISDTHYRYDLFHADGKDYMAWDTNNDGKDLSKYTMDNWLRSRYLSTSPYPYSKPETLVTNASLTDESTPAATLFTANAEGLLYMGKAITNISMADDGTISFDFMNPHAAGIAELAPDKAGVVGWYDLNGRRLSAEPQQAGIYISVSSDGTKRKCAK